MSAQNRKAFEDIVELPLSKRSRKPRSYGITMVIDKGLGLRAAEDLVEVAGDAVDIVKLAFGTSRLCPEEIVKRKVELYRSYSIDVMTGGTFLEVVLAQGKLESFLARAKELGFNAIEVSDGTIPMDEDTRRRVVREVLEAGYKVITEVGSKFQDMDLEEDKLVKGIELDLELGAFKVIVEAREAGKGVGIYDERGQIRANKLEALVQRIRPERIIFEAPEKAQQVELIKRFGQNVNLGNIQPWDVIALEALRTGLRADTLRGLYS